MEPLNPESTPQPTQAQTLPTNRKINSILAALLVVVIVGVGAYFVLRDKSINLTQENKQIVVSEKMETLLIGTWQCDDSSKDCYGPFLDIYYDNLQSSDETNDVKMDLYPTITFFPKIEDSSNPIGNERDASETPWIYYTNTGKLVSDMSDITNDRSDKVEPVTIDVSGNKLKITYYDGMVHSYTKITSSICPSIVKDIEVIPADIQIDPDHVGVKHDGNLTYHYVPAFGLSDSDIVVVDSYKGVNQSVIDILNKDVVQNKKPRNFPGINLYESESGNGSASDVRYDIASVLGKVGEASSIEVDCVDAFLKTLPENQAITLINRSQSYSEYIYDEGHNVVSRKYIHYWENNSGASCASCASDSHKTIDMTTGMTIDTEKLFTSNQKAYTILLQPFFDAGKELRLQKPEIYDDPIEPIADEGECLLDSLEDMKDYDPDTYDITPEFTTEGLSFVVDQKGSHYDFCHEEFDMFVPYSKLKQVDQYIPKDSVLRRFMK